MDKETVKSGNEDMKGKRILYSTTWRRTTTNKKLKKEKFYIKIRPSRNSVCIHFDLSIKSTLFCNSCVFADMAWCWENNGIEFSADLTPTQAPLWDTWKSRDQIMPLIGTIDLCSVIVWRRRTRRKHYIIFWHQNKRLDLSAFSRAYFDIKKGEYVGRRGWGFHNGGRYLRKREYRTTFKKGKVKRG